jgi:hypothetical protein
MASISEDTMRDTYSYNLDDLIQDSIESSSLISNYYKINSKYINKKGNIYNRSNSTLAIHKKINNRYRDNLNNSRSTNQSEDSKTKFFKKENKENQVTLFNNSFIREKQRTFRLRSAKIKKYNLFLNYSNKNNNEIKDRFKIVNNDINLYKAFLDQTKSNFNNKYKVIYSISDFKQKGKIKRIYDTIKNYQNKSCFTKYLEKKLNKRCLSSKSIIKKDDNFNPNSLSLSGRWNEIILHKKTNNFLENFNHRNNLIKVKTLDYMKNKILSLQKKDNYIIYNNNSFFKTMPIKPIIKNNNNI